MGDGTDDRTEPEVPAEFTEAGAIVDRAIAQMLSRDLPPMAIASALLGGSLCFLSRSLGDEAVLQILHNAAAGVSAGELRRRK